MKKITVPFDLLCDSHILLFELLKKIHFLKVIETVYLTDPLLIDEIICSRVTIEIPKWRGHIIDWLLGHCIDPDGQDKINRLIDRGVVGQIPKKDSSKLWGWKVLFWILCWKDIITGKIYEEDY